MTPAERFKQWIDNLAQEWQDRLRGWMTSWLSLGIEVLLDVVGKAAAPKLRPLIERLERETTIPDELKPIFDELKEPKGEIAAIFAQSAGGALVGGAIGKVLDYVLRPITFGLSFSPEFVILDPVQQISLWLRGEITDSALEAALRKNGFGTENMRYLKALVSPRLDPQTAIRAQFRGIISSKSMQRTLKDQAWRDEDIKTLWEVAHVMPSATEAIGLMAHEAFEEGMVAKYGLDDEFEGLDFAFLEKIGITKDIAKLHWRGHWQHPSFTQVLEMFRRKLITILDFRQWFRVVEIPPFWRDFLIEVSHAWPTRVDVRRWWDLRTIDEAELRRLYEGMGYHGINLDNYILWTKVFTAFPDLIARWKNGWITVEEVSSELIGLGMPAERVGELIQTKIKASQPERTAKERDVTKSEIVKGVKKEVITAGEGIELLMDLGYDRDEADYILAINLEALSGSPEDYATFKGITGKYRRAIGQEAKAMPEELKAAAAEVVRLTDEVKALADAIVEEDRKLIDEDILPEAATERKDELLKSHRQAEAELARVKTEYERQLAAWRHGG